jgi:hypothetical protein
MMATKIVTKLNAQVVIKNLQHMHEKSLPPTHTNYDLSNSG